MDVRISDLGGRYAPRKTVVAASPVSSLAQRMDTLNQARVAAGTRQAADDIGIHELMFLTVEEDAKRRGIPLD